MGVEFFWRCLDCDEHGTGPTSDKDAEKHVKVTKHSTLSGAAPRG